MPLKPDIGSTSAPVVLWVASQGASVPVAYRASAEPPCAAAAAGNSASAASAAATAGRSIGGPRYEGGGRIATGADRRDAESGAWTLERGGGHGRAGRQGGDRHRIGARHRPRDRGAALGAGSEGGDQRPRRRPRRPDGGRDRRRDGGLRRRPDQARRAG